MASRTATVKAVVLGDASEFKEAMKDVEVAADKAGDSVKRDLNESFDALGEGAGSAEQKFIGLSDSITGTQDVMEGLRTGNVAQLAMGFADLAGAAEALWTSVGKTITTWWAKVTATTADTAATATNTTATIGQRIATVASTIATKAQAAAQWALNTALSANPIALVVIALAALVAGFVIAYKNVDWFRNAVDAVARFFVDTFWPILKQVGEWIGTAFVALWHAGSAAVSFMWDRLQVLWSVLSDTLWPLLQTVAGWIGDYFVFQFNAAVTIVSGLIDVFQWLWDKVTRYVLPALETLASWIGTYFVTQWNIATTAVGWVIDKLQALWDKANAVKDGIFTAFDAVVGFIGGLGERISNAASGMWDGIKSSFRSAINSIIGWWNNLSFSMPGIDVPLGPDIPGFTVSTPNIPYLAGGGLVKGGRGGTLAMIGEGRSDELVVPLDRAARNGLGGNTFNIYASPGTNARDLGREIRKLLNEYGRAV